MKLLQIASILCLGGAAPFYASDAERCVSDAEKASFDDTVIVTLPSGEKIKAFYLGLNSPGRHDVMIDARKVSLVMLSDKTAEDYFSLHFSGKQLEEYLEPLDLFQVITVDATSILLLKGPDGSSWRGGGLDVRASLIRLFSRREHFDRLLHCVSPYKKVHGGQEFFRIYVNRFDALLSIVERYWGYDRFREGWKVLRESINWQTLHSVTALEKAAAGLVRILEKGAVISVEGDKHSLYFNGSRVFINMDCYGARYDDREKRDLASIKGRI